MSRISFTPHALRRLRERGIERRDVRHAVETAVIRGAAHKDREWCAVPVVTQVGRVWMTVLYDRRRRPLVRTAWIGVPPIRRR